MTVESRLSVIVCVTLVCTACTLAQPAREPEKNVPTKHVILVSVDGLMPGAYLDPDAHGLTVPTLRAMKAGGAHATHMLSVFPSVTYPAHTSMVTGTTPMHHGVVGNRLFDPLESNKGGWFWYSEDIKVPTLWDAARAAGRKTALINWPVTVGAQADAIVPEYWRAGTREDVKLAKAISTRGLLDQVAARFPDFWQHFTPPDVQDKASIDIAIHLLQTSPPELMLIHMWMVDEYQHRDGPWSQTGNQRIEEADRQLGRLIEAAKRAGIWERTTLYVVSDHGFLPISRRIRLGTRLRERGLVTMNESDDKVTAWRAGVLADGGMAYVYLQDPADSATADAVEALLAELVTSPEAGVARTYSNAEIVKRGGDPRAFMAAEARVGFAFKGGYTGPLLISTGSKGHHGYDPERPEMHASLLVYGPEIASGVIAGARIIDLAPTIAKQLALSMPQAAGIPLDIPRVR